MHHTEVVRVGIIHINESISLLNFGGINNVNHENNRRICVPLLCVLVTAMVEKVS